MAPTLGVRLQARGSAIISNSCPCPNEQLAAGFMSAPFNGRPSSKDKMKTSRADAVTRPSKTLKAVSRVLGGAAVIIWLVFIAQGLQYDATRPTVAPPSEGRAYSLNNHGHVVYLTSEEQDWLDLLVRAAISLFLLGFALDSIQHEPQFHKGAWRSVLATLYGLTTPTSHIREPSRA